MALPVRHNQLFEVRIACKGLSSSWRLTRILCDTPERAIELAEARERADGYEPIAVKAEAVDDPHFYADKGVWPF